MKYIFMFLAAVLVSLSDVCGQVVFAGDVYGDEKTYRDDIVVNSDITVAPTQVLIANDLTLVNYGTVQTRFNVQDGYKLFLENHNVINADFVLGADASVVQVISGADSLKDVDFNVRYSVLVNATDSILLNDVFALSDGADKIILDNATVRLDDVALGNNIEVRGSVNLVLDDINGLCDKILLDGITGSGEVAIVADSDNNMYINLGVVSDGVLYFRRVRETNYEKILNNDVGLFLNNLRVSNQNDTLFDALDSATDVGELSTIMSRSVRFNPEYLRRVVAMVNELNIMPVAAYESGVGIAPVLIMTDDFYAYGVAADAQYVGRNLLADVRVNVARLMYESELDTFDGMIYGVGANLGYSFDNGWFVNAATDLSIAEFDVGNVLYDNRMIKNPNGVSFGVNFDVGYRMDIVERFYVSPFVGVVGDYHSVDDWEWTDAGLRAGVDAGYGMNAMGLKYDYGIRVSADTIDTIMVAGRAGVWSEMDELGADVTVATVRMFDTFGYKLALNVKVAF